VLSQPDISCANDIHLGNLLPQAVNATKLIHLPWRIGNASVLHSGGELMGSEHSGFLSRCAFFEVIRRLPPKFFADTAFWIRALTVLAIVFGMNLIIEFGVLTSVFPLLHELQLGSHRILCWMLPRPVSPKWTRMVVINEELHEELGVPTDRKYLATLVRNAARGDAAVIVLDFELLEEQAGGHDATKQSEMNEELRNAIWDAAKLGVPVIVPCSLDLSGEKAKVFPSIYPDAVLPIANEKDQCSFASTTGATVTYPACARRGYVNPAKDERKIPLGIELPGNTQCQDSLALASATAYEEATDRQPRTRQKKAIAGDIRNYRYVYGSFLAEERDSGKKCKEQNPEDRCKVANFQTISIRDLEAGTPEAMRECRTRIVVIGGEWKEAPGRSENFDMHETSVGPMAGIYLQANYIEAILDDRYMKEVPAVPALFFDIVVAALLYVSYHNASTTRGRYVILSVFLFPLMTGYIVFLTLGYYLDFVLPLVGCFAHLGFEFVSDDIKMRRERRQTEAAETGASQ
jgi:CHASE2 domain-containing sensor protein